MKRAVAIFLLCLYSFAAIGGTVHAHYCMSRLISCSVLPSNQKVCDNCGMPKEKSHGCCHDEQKQVKAHADHQASTIVNITDFFAQPFLTANQAFYLPAKIPSSFIVYPVTHAPPDILSNTLYLQYGMLLI